MKRGRPTLYEQKKIKDEIFLYYENNIDAITALKIKNTVEWNHISA